MPRRSARRKTAASSSNEDGEGVGGRDDPSRENNDNNIENNGVDGADNQQQRSVAAHVRDRQRAVAEREASRLARPEARPKASLGHADRKKSAVSSTPFGVLTKQDKNITYDKEAWCGPFSVARQMIAEREEARRQREAELEDNEYATGAASHPLDGAMLELENDRKRKAHPSLSWKSNKKPMGNSARGAGSVYAQRQKRAEVRSKARAMPSLFSMCVNFLVDNFDCVESLGYVDNTVRTAIVKELVAQNKMDAQSFQTIAEVGIEALEMVDCSQLSQELVAASLRELLPNGLRYLVLDQAGCCFGPKTVDAIVSTVSSADKSKGSCDLFALSVGGAYLLKDTDAAKLVTALATSVSSLAFCACPMLRTEFCRAITDSYSTNGCSDLIELSLEDLTLNDETLETLIAKPECLTKLRSLTLKRIEGMTDVSVAKILEIAGPSLERLDLSDNHTLTDESLATIRRTCGLSLKALNLGGLRQLTGHGLEALFMHVPGMSPPPSLRALDLGRCDHEAVTDDLMDLITQAATKIRTDDDKGTTIEQLELQGGLVRLNIQGSAVVTDTSMEALAATCARTLEELNISFCTRVSNKGVGYLVDKCSDKLSKIDIWGCAQITDVFLDGHRRVNDPDLEIAGAWIKKTSSREIND